MFDDWSFGDLFDFGGGADAIPLNGDLSGLEDPSLPLPPPDPTQIPGITVNPDGTLGGAPEPTLWQSVGDALGGAGKSGWLPLAGAGLGVMGNLMAAGTASSGAARAAQIYSDAQAAARGPGDDLKGIWRERGKKVF